MHYYVQFLKTIQYIYNELILINIIHNNNNLQKNIFSQTDLTVLYKFNQQHYVVLMKLIHNKVQYYIKQV